MDGFYEWKKGIGKVKIPLRIQTTNQEVFFMAGIYDNWKNPEGKVIPSFSIITMPANEFMKPIHDRMPCILLPEEERLWLEEGLSIQASLQLLKPYPDDWMRAYEVSSLVNNVRNNDASLVVPV